MLEVVCVYIPYSKTIYLIAFNSHEEPIIILSNTVNSNIFKVLQGEEMEPVFEFCLEFLKQYKEVLPGSEYAILVPERVRKGRVMLTHNPETDLIVSKIVQAILDPQAAQLYLEAKIAQDLLNYKTTYPN